MALLVSFIVFSVFTFYKKVRLASTVVGSIMSVLAIGTIGMTYIVGHSGAESVWKKQYAKAKQPINSQSRAISIDEVRLHNTHKDCWTVVGESVYDVTSFVSRHPAGSPAIKEMCGKNASEDYLGEHSGQREPEMWLEKLKIGTLKK
jgi:cytochrome b involved in lipid metabolism